MPSLLTLLPVLLWNLIQPSQLLASAVAILHDGRTVLVVSQTGELQSWEKGSDKPNWTSQLGNTGKPSSSQIVLTHKLANGVVLFVERYGAVHAVDINDPPHITSKTPIVADTKFPPNMDKGDRATLQKVAAQDGIMSAALDQQGYLLMNSQRAKALYQIDLQKLLEYPEEVVPLLRKPPFVKELKLPITGKNGTSSLAVCPSATLLGMQDGSLYVFPKGDMKSARVGKLVSEKAAPNAIDVVGCLHMNDESYTVSNSHESGNGQIQLWSLNKAVVVDSADADSDGKPLYTFTAIPNSSGTRLLTLSDLRLRVWINYDHRLVLEGKQSISNTSGSYAAAALPDGKFLLYDGATLWTITDNGNSKEYFAGTHP